MGRLFIPLFLHGLFLAALVGGVASTWSADPRVPLSTRALWQITAVQKEPFPWGEHPPEANNLSGIVHVEGDRYALVSDKGGNIVWARIGVDGKTGAIVSARIMPQVAHVEGAKDMEGCALAPDGRTLVVSDEEDASLARVPLAWGQSGTLAPLQREAWVFRDCRNNLSLESLATATDGSGYWTMNEESLLRDGARSDLVAGAWLRLVKVDNGLRCVHQWAYRSDPAPGPYPVPFMSNGVSDLLALPDRQLVVLERAFGARGFRIRLYLVDPLDMTSDVSAVEHLDREKDMQALPKQLLYEWDGTANFEGIAFGPQLEGGDRSILLVCDDGDPFSKPCLLALRLHRVTEAWSE